MKHLEVFKNPKFGDIRVSLSENDEPLFCLADLCKALKITNSRNVRSRLDDDDVRLIDTIDNLGRTQHSTYVTESGFYEVVLRSDSDKAKPFRKCGYAAKFCLLYAKMAVILLAEKTKVTKT